MPNTPSRPQWGAYAGRRPAPVKPAQPEKPSDPYADLKDFVDSLQEEWLAEVPDLPAQGVPCVARLVRLGYYIARRVDANLERFGLTRGEFEVLAVLVRNPEADITPKILQTKILITSGGLSNRVKRLEEKGLVVRLPDPHDRRGVILKTTDAGRELTLRAVTAHMKVENDFMKGMSKDKQLELAKLLKELILSQSGELNPMGLR